MPACYLFDSCIDLPLGLQPVDKPAAGRETPTLRAVTGRRGDTFLTCADRADGLGLVLRLGSGRSLPGFVIGIALLAFAVITRMDALVGCNSQVPVPLACAFQG